MVRPILPVSKGFLNGRNVEMIFSVIHPEKTLITEYLTDFYAGGFETLLMMSPVPEHLRRILIEVLREAVCAIAFV